MLRLLQQLSWWVALAMAPVALAGEQKPIELSVVPEAIRAITRDKLPDIRLVSANTETDPDGGTCMKFRACSRTGTRWSSISIRTKGSRRSKSSLGMIWSLAPSSRWSSASYPAVNPTLLKRAIRAA